ncbi:hypothetical protein Q8A73_015110 [Channa argus]|nr:hypothetical protein Q8A73_015110 [Channa argus]
MERKYIEETFPGNDSMFSSLRLSTSGNYATLIATSDRNILRVGPLQEVVDLDLKVRTMVVQLDHQSFDYVNVSYSTSMSMQWEFEKSPVSVIYLFSISYTIAITFSIISCWRLDNVWTKVWVAFCGVLTTGLAILSSFGALLLLGQPFVMTVASCPFLILGIGLDDMFIMISCWQKTRVVDSVSDRLAGTYKEAAVSITITTLTDALALFLGYSSPFGSVRSFCLYAAISVCFCYLYSITFLGACMALNGQREAENKHWFTCAKIPEDVPCRNSKAFSICCVGGSYDRMTGKEETEPTLNRTPVEDIMIGLREAAAECPVKLLVYHPAFIYFDQYTVIMNNTIQTLLVAVVDSWPNGV